MRLELNLSEAVEQMASGAQIIVQENADGGLIREFDFDDLLVGRRLYVELDVPSVKSLIEQLAGAEVDRRESERESESKKVAEYGKAIASGAQEALGGLVEGTDYVEVAVNDHENSDTCIPSKDIDEDPEEESTEEEVPEEECEPDDLTEKYPEGSPEMMLFHAIYGEGAKVEEGHTLGNLSLDQVRKMRTIEGLKPAEIARAAGCGITARMASNFLVTHKIKKANVQ